MKKTITNELDLLIRRQSKGKKKTVANELSIVEKLEEELKERKRESKRKMKEEEDKQTLKNARLLMKKLDIKNPQELESLTLHPALTQEQQEALNPLLHVGKEIMDQPNKFIDLNILKKQISLLYQSFSKVKES